MLKHKRKTAKSTMLKGKKFRPLHDDLDIPAEEIEEGDFEYGDTNDLFEENIRETVEKGD